MHVCLYVCEMGKESQCTNERARMIDRKIVGENERDRGRERDAREDGKANVKETERCHGWKKIAV